MPVALLWPLRPIMRYSLTRDAYVLRVIGNRVGPVLVTTRPATVVDDGPAAPAGAVEQDAGTPEESAPQRV